MNEDDPPVEEMVATGEAPQEPPLEAPEAEAAPEPVALQRSPELQLPETTGGLIEATEAEPPPAPKKKKRPPAPKEQCDICLRWYNPTVMKRGHKCVKPVKASQLATTDGGTGASPVAEDASPEAHTPPPIARQASFVETPPPVELPSWESVARWASHERETRRERKRGRWEQQMFG